MSTSETSDVDPLLRSLGQRIRDLRAARGWSQEEFADVCGVHRTYIGHVERGEKNVSVGTLARVAGAFEIKLSELFAGIEDGVAAKERTVRRKIGPADRHPLGSLLQELREQREVLKDAIAAVQKSGSKPRTGRSKAR
jgi:transcriptional regulator with XRE-family HTH domain